MTDEQWLWLYVNQAIDSDEKLERMCTKCREEITSGQKKCIRCGKEVYNAESFVNPNFDMDKYNKMANDDYDDDCDCE